MVICWERADLLALACDVYCFLSLSHVVSWVRRCHALASVHCCLVVICWDRADFMALACDAHGLFVTFPCGVLESGVVLNLSIPDLCCLSYFYLFALGNIE